VLLPILLAAAPSTQPGLILPEVVDDIVFREALRARGLYVWAEAVGAEAAANGEATDEIGRQLRRRERLLADAGVLPTATVTGPASGRDPGAVQQASEILARLIADHPANPGRYRWMYELARDYLERTSPAAFERRLLYELPGRDREVVRDLSGRAVDVLTGLRRQIADAWKSVEELDEAELVAMRDAGSLAALETLDAQSAALLGWAQLHYTLAADLDEPRRQAALSELLAEVQRSGRLELPAGREFEQAGALLMAAVAERHLGLHDQADSRARQIIAVLGRIADKSLRDRLRQTALVAVLEQIRAVRDAGRYDAALQAIEQARQWAIKSRADEPAALVSVSLLEASVQYAKQQAALAAEGGVSNWKAAVKQPTEGVAWLHTAACLTALEKTARQSPAHRDLMYAVLAPALAGVELPENPHLFALQLLAGAAIADARENPSAKDRLQMVIAALRARLARPVDNRDAQAAGELTYLLGAALALTGADLEAVRFLTDLAEQNADHDRGESAIRQAVALAGRELRRAGGQASPESRSAFVRAARVMRQRVPDDPNVPGLTYAIGATLESDGRFEEAAGEYAAVPVGSEHALDAALGRIRCWRQALERAAVGKGADDGATSSRIADAKAAVDAVREQYPFLSETASSVASAASRPAPTGCDRARLLLATAELLNHPEMGMSQAAADLTMRFDGADCPELLGAALRSRILALRQLRRLAEARAVVEQYLRADPEHAGTAMAGLLQSMHEETMALRNREDAAAAASVAAEAVQVGQSLLAWAVERPERLRPSDTIVIRCWYATALLNSGRAAEALTAFEQIEQDTRGVLPDNSGTLTEIRLGKADALLETGEAGPALEVYTAVWQACPEHSEPWWHAFVGSLRCHARQGSDPAVILQSIRQQRFLAPDLGGPYWKRELTRLEEALTARLASRPAQE